MAGFCRGGRGVAPAGFIRASEWLERFLYRHADRLVVNSPGFIEHVKRRGGRRVELVPNGADTAMFDPSLDGADFRRQHDLEGKFVALYAGAHGMSNDLDVLLEAAERLQDKTGDQDCAFRRRQRKAGATSQGWQRKGCKMSFSSPRLPKTSIPHALAAADACIAILKPIELYKTVYPNKVFDYMAAGRPVILAIDGVIRQVVETAGAGIPVPPGDPESLAQAINRLAADPQEGQADGQRGRVYVEAHFDRASLADELLKVIEDSSSTGR
jgi:glycosyltransferase involved in cell wall biosynthesis